MERLFAVLGVAIGYFLPGLPRFLGSFEYAHVSIPVAILIWLMIYPMMLNVDFASVKNAGKKPRGLVVTLVVGDGPLLQERPAGQARGIERLGHGRSLRPPTDMSRVAIPPGACRMAPWQPSS